MRFRFFPRTAQIAAVLGVVALAALSGCSNTGSVELAPAQGVVTINGQPAANVMVQFLPQVKKGELGPTSSGVSGQKGEFELVTQDGKPGAMVGACKVLLTDMEEERPAQGQTAVKRPRIPSDYTTVNPRTIEVEVKPGGEPITIEVRS
jgi:hypothetical protein